MSVPVAQEDFFARVPKPIVYHPDLTGNDVRVYATLSERAGSKRSTWPSVRRIAEDIGVSTTTVQKALDKLEQLGLIQVERTGGKVNLYYLPLVGTVSETDTPPEQVYQKMTRTVSETDTELDQGTTTSPNGEVRHQLFEAFFEVWTRKPYRKGVKVPKATKSRIAAAVKDAVGAGITPDEVRERGERYRREWPKMEPTPQALLANWLRFDGSADPPTFDPEACAHPAAADRDGDGRLWCPACDRYLEGEVSHAV